MSLDPRDFEQFQLDGSATVTLSLRELRPLLSFCDANGFRFQFHFNQGGDPVIFTAVGDEDFEADLVLATLCSEDTSQPTPSSQAVRSQEAGHGYDAVGRSSFPQDISSFDSSYISGTPMRPLEQSSAQGAHRGRHTQEFNQQKDRASVLGKRPASSFAGQDAWSPITGRGSVTHVSESRLSEVSAARITHVSGTPLRDSNASLDDDEDEEFVEATPPSDDD